MDAGTRLPGGEGARDEPYKLVVVARATRPSMREACVDFQGSPEPLLDFPSRSLGGSRLGEDWPRPVALQGPVLSPPLALGHSGAGSKW